MTIRFELNGAAVEVAPREREALLDTLRERCGIRSIKNGCQPQGQCGCCLVLIDGRALTSCVIPTAKVAGKSVLTLEGIADAERRLIARAFVDSAGLQCGFCIPGLALRAKYLIDKNPDPARAEIARAIDVHLCRCTGYTKIIDAIEMLARARRGEALTDRPVGGGVGTRLDRYQAAALVLGEREFVDDITRADMLHGAVALSAYPRATVRAINTSRARNHPGVVAVVTAADVGGDRWYGIIDKDWPGMVAVGEQVRYVGDIIAAVAAVDRESARAAAELIDVDYEVLEPLLDTSAALAEGAARVNPIHDNQMSRTLIQRGDVDAVFAASAHVVSGQFSTQRIEHLFMETESAVAEPRPDGRLHLYSQGQGVFDDRRQVAAFLGCEPDHIFVELVPSGGSFGGKEDLTIQAHAALLAEVTGKPVKLTLSRQQSIRVHPKRHPMTLDYSVGCDSAGHLTGVRARIIGDTGAYASVGAKVLERAAGHACGPYRVDAVDIEALAVMTNNPPCGAMRGFGVNQVHFALEACVDLLAAEVGLDGWEMRWRNAVDIGDHFATGQPFTKSVGIKATLSAVRDAYYRAREAGRAIGIACGIKNSGIGNGATEWGRARLVVGADEVVTIYGGFTEMGQGLLTILIQCAVEVTGLPAASFRACVNSTHVLDCGQTTGSRATLLGGRAVAAAAHALKAELDAGNGLAELAGRVYAGDITVDDTTAPGADCAEIKTHTAFGFATQLCILDDEGRVDRFVAAHDVGRVLNPDLCEGQIEGAIHMGLGYALTEELACEGGWPVTYKLRELGVLRARDMPEVEVILIEEAEPEGPFGAKGVGEIGLVPTAAAVGNALAAFDGERRYSLPMKDSPAARAMSVGRVKKLRA